MSNPGDAALMNTSAGKIGAWVGGFIIPMVVGYIFLRVAGSPNRKPTTAIVLRVIAVLVSAFLAYAGYSGSGGHVNPGGVLAVVVTLLWALYQQFSRKAV